MTSPRARISQITGLTDAADLGAVEAIMRLEQSIEALTPRAFEIEAKIAHRVYVAMDDVSRAWYRGEGRRVS